MIHSVEESCHEPEAVSAPASTEQSAELARHCWEARAVEDYRTYLYGDSVPPDWSANLEEMIEQFALDKMPAPRMSIEWLQAVSGIAGKEIEGLTAAQSLRLIAVYALQCADSYSHRAALGLFITRSGLMGVAELSRLVNVTPDAIDVLVSSMTESLVKDQMGYAQVAIAALSKRVPVAKPTRESKKDAQKPLAGSTAKQGGPVGGAEGVPYGSIRRYLNEIRKIPLLNAAEEVELAQAIEAGLYAERLLLGAQAADWQLTTEMQRDLQRLVHEGKTSYDHFVQSNLRLAATVANHYLNRGLDYLDLVQLGNEGVMHAVKKFDFTRGTKFSTYCEYWIKQRITRGLAEIGQAILLPKPIYTSVGKLKGVTAMLAGILNREPTDLEIAKEMEITVEQVAEYQLYARRIASLDEDIFDDGVELSETIASDGPSSEEIVETYDVQERLAKVFGALPARQAGVIMRRFGLHDDREWSHQEIADLYRVNTALIIHIEQEMMPILREIMNDMA